MGIPWEQQTVWTDERVILLKKLWADGDSCSQIAGAINTAHAGAFVTRNAVIGKISRLGLSGRVKVAKPRSKTAHDRDRGTKQRIVAKILKVRSPSNGGARVEPVVVHEPAPKPPEFLGIALLDLDSPEVPQQCRFPHGGDEPGQPIFFCGQPTVGGTSWCQHCLAIVSAPPRPKKPRAYLPIGGAKPAVF